MGTRGDIFFKFKNFSAFPNFAEPIFYGFGIMLLIYLISVRYHPVRKNPQIRSIIVQFFNLFNLVVRAAATFESNEIRVQIPPIGRYSMYFKRPRLAKSYV